MYQETIENFATIAEKKTELLKKNFSGYFISSLLAGVYVGFGIVLIFAIGGSLFQAENPFLRFIMGISFGIALTLVIFAGSELYTGNTMIMTYGVLRRKISLWELVLIWLVSWLGNLLGGIILSFLVYISDSASSFAGLLGKIAQVKTDLSILDLIVRGFLCNLLVCLAIWMSGKTKDDSAKIFLIFWCLFAFIGSGFEHSIANMSLLSLGVFQNGLGWLKFFYNIFWVTIGNTLGGITLALSYYLISKKG